MVDPRESLRCRRFAPSKENEAPRRTNDGGDHRRPARRRHRPSICTSVHRLSGEPPSRGRIALLRKVDERYMQRPPPERSPPAISRALAKYRRHGPILGCGRFTSSHAGGGRERAILQEGLLKRMIDERNAGNTGVRKSRTPS